MPPADVPPMDAQMPMGNGPEMPPMGDMPQPQDAQNEFDTNFDAGVEADEEQDPKKYIQQLTGKLSQSLRKYTEDNGQPDADLNKYVAGMIVKQALDGLSQEDADEIIDKVKSDEDFEAEGEQDFNGDEMGQQAPPMQPQQPDMGQAPNESIKRNGKYNLKEIIDGVLDNYGEDEGERQPYRQVKDKGGFRKKPFSSPNFNR